MAIIRYCNFAENNHYTMSRLFVISILLPLLLSSCLVGKKKLDASLADNQQLQTENQVLLDRLDDQTKKNVDLDMENQGLREEIVGLKGDTAKANKQIRDLQQMYTQLNNKTKQDLARSTMENQQLQNELEQKKRELEDKEKQLQEREKRLNELQALLDAKDKAITDLKKKIEDALLNFNQEDLTVELRDGKIYVSLAEQLLFQSGSTTVDPKGKEALVKLAQALKSQTDIDILIEGHTDSIPIKTSKIQDNWDLSVLRATSIVRILTDNGIDPKQVVPSGRGEFVPVASNATKEGRASNRRIEIILSPNLDEVFKILEGN